MRVLPNPPRTGGFSDPEAVVNALREWFWALADLNVDFVDPPRWTHDDNRQAMTYGFAIVAVPLAGSNGRKVTRMVLMSLKREVDLQSVEDRIKKLAPIDPLCAKALAALTASKLIGE
jgi:hypothetical protein